MQERRESSSKINGLIRWFERQKRVYDSVWPRKTRAVTDQSGALFIGNVQEKNAPNSYEWTMFRKEIGVHAVA